MITALHSYNDLALRDILISFRIQVTCTCEIINNKYQVSFEHAPIIIIINRYNSFGCLQTQPVPERWSMQTGWQDI